MDFTHLLIEEKYLDAIGWTLAHSIWQIALISMLLWIILIMIPEKASQWRYGSAIFALLLIFAAGCWTFVYQLDQYKERSDLSFATVQVVDAAAISTNSGIIAENPSFENQAVEKLEHYLPYLVNLWVLGVLFYFSRLIGSFYDLEKLHKKHHESVSASMLRKVECMCSSMGILRNVQVMKSTLVSSPITYGLIKPVILLPAGLVFSIHPAQLEAIIAHELAHIKRNDYLVNFFQSLLEALFFFHPCFWWINNMVSEEREKATDDLALSSGISASALAYGLAEVANHSDSHTPEMALAASGNTHFTLHRIKRIMGKKTPSPKFSPLLHITMILALIISSVLIVGAQEQERKDKDELLLTTLKTLSAPLRAPIHIKFLGINEEPTQDTIPAKKKPTPPSMEGMPKLELTPAPKIDVEISVLPDMPPVPAAPAVKFHFPNIDVKLHADSLGKIAKELEEIEGDNSSEAKQRREALKSAMDQVEQNIEELTEAYQEKMEDWQEEHQPAFEQFEHEMELWSEKMEEHAKSWESSFAPQMKEFEERMKQWEKENAPKLKEFEEKMKRWEKENAPKFKKFEEEMKIWTEEHKENIHPNKSTRSNNFLNFNGALNVSQKEIC